MKKVAIGILLCLAGVLGSAHAQEDPLKLGLDVSRASTVIDLADTPPAIWLLQTASLALTERALQREFEAQFLRFQSTLQTQLDSPGVGYLVGVRLYFDEFGSPIVPGGQLFAPIGIGTEPLDAFAEWYRSPQLSAGFQVKPTWTNASYFLWLVKRDGKLVAWTINKNFREAFENRAFSEAKRRDRLGEWQAITAEHTAVVIRASFWLEMYRDRGRRLRSDQDRERIADLNRQMAALEDRFNDVYLQYQRMAARQARDQKFLEALQIASSVASVLQSGLNARQLISQNGKAANAGGVPPSNNSVEWVRREVTIRGDNIRVLEERVRTQYDGLIRLDESIGKAYQDSGVPVPKRDWPAVIRPR